jgi:spore coat protein U-like protein
MTDGSANSLAYQLYTSGTFSSIWGDGTGGSVTVSGNGDGTAQALTVYGRIGTAQFVPAGNYSDRVAVTVNY